MHASIAILCVLAAGPLPAGALSLQVDRPERKGAGKGEPPKLVGDRKADGSINLHKATAKSSHDANVSAASHKVAAKSSHDANASAASHTQANGSIGLHKATTRGAHGANVSVASYHKDHQAAGKHHKAAPSNASVKLNAVKSAVAVKEEDAAAAHNRVPKSNGTAKQAKAVAFQKVNGTVSQKKEKAAKRQQIPASNATAKPAALHKLNGTVGLKQEKAAKHQKAPASVQAKPVAFHKVNGTISLKKEKDAGKHEKTSHLASELGKAIAKEYKSADKHQKAANTHQKANATHEKTSATYQKTNASHQKANATHQKTTASHQKANATNKKANTTHQKTRETHQTATATHQKDNATHKKANATHKKANATDKKANTTHQKTGATHKKASATHQKGTATAKLFKGKNATKTANVKPVMMNKLHKTVIVHKTKVAAGKHPEGGHAAHELHKAKHSGGMLQKGHKALNASTKLLKGHNTNGTLKLHKADYNYMPSDFNLAGTMSGYLNFITKYPCTRSAGTQAGFPTKFDWILHRTPDLERVDMSEDPYAVFSSMELHTVPAMLKELETRWPDSKKNRVAYFTGDMMLSRVDKNFGKGTEDRLRKAFPGGVWWQAYDVTRPGFKVAPDGLNGMYLMPVWDVAQKAINTASLESKTKGVLAAWGKFHPNLDAMIPARRKLHEWVGTPGSIAAGVEHASFDPRAYWTELAKYRFTLSPRGGGIQSPKNDEALLVLTIPISTREGSARGPKTEPAFDGLKKLGWPMVVLDEWSDITKPQLDQWWTELSPRLLSFRKNCLTTEGFWRIITGQVTYCE